MNFRVLSFLLATLAIIPSVYAYPLRVLAWDDAIAARKLGILHSKGTEELTDLDPFRRTKTIEVSPGKDTSAFIQCLDRKSADGKPLVSPIKIAAGMNRPLLVILPDDKSPIGFRLIALEDDLASFSWGSIRLVNVTGKKLVFKADKSLTALPAAWLPVQVNPGGTDRNIQVQLFHHDQPKPPIYASVWEQRNYYRNLVFLMPGSDPSISSIECKFINEDRRVAEAEEKTKSN